MTIQRHWRRALVLAGALAIGAFGWWRVVDYAAPIDSYRVLDARTISFTVISGHGDSCRVTTFLETATEVRLGADCLNWLPLPRTAEGVLVELTVGLAQPLGDRRVEDCSSGTCLPVPGS